MHGRVPCFLILALILLCSAVAHSKQKPTIDHIVQAYPAQYGADLDDASLKALNNRSFNRTDRPFNLLPDTALPNGTNGKDRKTAYLVHVTRWDTVNGVFGMTGNYGSTWYLFRAVCKKDSKKKNKGQNDTQNCTFARLGVKADGKTPLLYGYKVVWLIGVTHFAQPIDIKDFSLAYKISTAQTVSAGVQDFGSLVTALIGATPGNPPPTPANHALDGGVQKPLTTNTLIALARITSIDHLPFIINFNYVLSLNSTGGLPDARVGLPYSASLSVTGGNGPPYRYEVVNGTLPAGLSLDNSGSITGVPTGAGHSDFTVKVTDQSTPPIAGYIGAGITVNTGIVIDISSGATSFNFGNAIYGQYYSSGVFPTGGSGNYTLTLSGTIPEGLAFTTATGALSGVPRQLGPQSFRLAVKDSGANPPKTVNYTAQITVDPNSQVSVLTAPTTPFDIPPVTIGQQYLAAIGATGGTPPYSFSKQGVWPSGLTINNNGIVSGKADAIPLVDQNTGIVSQAANAIPVNRCQNSDNPNSCTKAVFGLTIADSSGHQVSAELAAPFVYDLVSVDLSKAIVSLPDGIVGSNYLAVIPLPVLPVSGSVPQIILDGGLPFGVLTEPVGNTLVVKGVPQVPGVFQGTMLLNGQKFAFRLLIRKSVLNITLGNQPSGGPGANTNPGGPGPGTGPAGAQPMTPGSGPPSGPGGPAGGPNAGPGGPPAGGQNQPQSGTQSSLPPIDCSSVAASSPCNFTDSFQSDAKELFDFSVGISIPGTREETFPGGASATPAIVRHADLYAFLDFFPSGFWISKDSLNGSAIPHFNFGVPVTSQPLHRPYFGISQSLTSWTRAEAHGFPFRINVFVGLVDMKQQVLLAMPGSTTQTLKTDWALKPMYGVEVPIGPVISRITGGKGSGGAGK